MNNPCVLAIDLGTTNCKTILLDEHLAIVRKASREFPLQLPQPGWAEQDPAAWWQAVADSVRETCAGIDPGIVRAIGLSGQMHGLVPLDRHNEVIRPAILWNDQRSASQCEAIYAAAGDRAGLLRHTNNPMLPGYTGGKILWMREHEIRLFEQIDKILLPKDYLRYRLCGEMATDYSDASGTGFFDVEHKRWARGLLDLLKIPATLFPRCLPSGEVAGLLSPAVAADLGLPAGLPVIVGGGDAVMQTVGSATLDSDSVLVVIGTGGNVTVSVPRFSPNPEGRLQFFCHVLPDRWVAMGVTLTAGSSLKWFRDVLGGPVTLAARDSGGSSYRLLDELAATSPPGANGLLFLPYLQGERCPYPDPRLRGAFLGLDLSSRKADLVRSILEGVVFSLRDVLEVILQAGIDPRRVVASGGGAASALWRQILADAFHREVITLKNSEDASTLGAAILAGISAGLWSSAGEAAALIRQETFERPNPSRADLYDRLFSLYRKQHSLLQPSFAELCQLKDS